MILVSDASPIISLARIDHLHILERLYGTVAVPNAVWQEVVVDGAGEPGADVVATADWIHQHAVTNRTLVTALQQELGAGEAEAIALAIQLDGAMLLIDERLGREVAAHMSIRCIGVAGLLMEAKKRGIVTAVAPLFTRLRFEADYRISDALLAEVLRAAGEAVE